MFSFMKKEEPILFHVDIELIQEYDNLRMRNHGPDLCEKAMEFEVFEYCDSVLPVGRAKP